MIEYTFKHGHFYFRIHAETDKDAVRKVRRAIEETSPEASDTYLKVDLLAGAFEGRIYLEPGEISTKNICRRDVLPEVSTDVPF
jgi:hypothetical protein